VIAATTELYLRTVLPSDATRYIEMDSGAPWTVFAHGAEHLRYLTERSLATGARDMAYMLFPDNPGDAIPTNHPYTVMLRKNHKKFEAIARLVGENPLFEGVDARTGAGLDADPRHDHYFGVAGFPLGRIGVALAPTNAWTTVMSGRQPWTV